MRAGLLLLTLGVLHPYPAWPQHLKQITIRSPSRLYLDTAQTDPLPVKLGTGAVLVEEGRIGASWVLVARTDSLRKLLEDSLSKSLPDDSVALRLAEYAERAWYFRDLTLRGTADSDPRYFLDRWIDTSGIRLSKDTLELPIDEARTRALLDGLEADLEDGTAVPRFQVKINGQEAQLSGDPQYVPERNAFVLVLAPAWDAGLEQVGPVPMTVEILPRKGVARGTLNDLLIPRSEEEEKPSKVLLIGGTVLGLFGAFLAWYLGLIPWLWEYGKRKLKERDQRRKEKATGEAALFDLRQRLGLNPQQPDVAVLRRASAVLAQQEEALRDLDPHLRQLGGGTSPEGPDAQAQRIDIVRQACHELAGYRRRELGAESAARALCAQLYGLGTERSTTYGYVEGLPLDENLWAASRVIQKAADHLRDREVRAIRLVEEELTAVAAAQRKLGERLESSVQDLVDRMVAEREALEAALRKEETADTHSRVAEDAADPSAVPNTADMKEETADTHSRVAEDAADPSAVPNAADMVDPQGLTSPSEAEREPGLVDAAPEPMGPPPWDDLDSSVESSGHDALPAAVAHPIVSHARHAKDVFVDLNRMVANAARLAQHPDERVRRFGEAACTALEGVRSAATYDHRRQVLVQCPKILAPLWDPTETPEWNREQYQAIVGEWWNVIDRGRLVRPLQVDQLRADEKKKILAAANRRKYAAGATILLEPGMQWKNPPHAREVLEIDTHEGRSFIIDDPVAIQAVLDRDAGVHFTMEGAG